MKSQYIAGNRVILCRHGETEWNSLHRFQGRSDIELNENGNLQAIALGKALQSEPIVAMYSSPLKRARETAAQVHYFHKSIPLLIEPDLIEMDLGEFEGMEANHWAEHYGDFRALWNKNPARLRMPGGESLEEVQKRVVSAFKRICSSASPESTLLLCSHNFVIVSILCFVSGTPLNQFREMRQDTTALNVILAKGETFQLVKNNDTSHLHGLNFRQT